MNVANKERALPSDLEFPGKVFLSDTVKEENPISNVELGSFFPYLLVERFFLSVLSALDRDVGLLTDLFGFGDSGLELFPKVFI